MGRQVPGEEDHVQVRLGVLVTVSVMMWVMTSLTLMCARVDSRVQGGVSHE